jgi:hypothetical protein
MKEGILMLKIKKSRWLIAVLVSLLMLTSFATFTFAITGTYNTYLPGSSLHDTLVPYKARSTATGGMSNTCTLSSDLPSTAVNDFVTWVDQQSIGGPVTYDLTIRKGQSKSYSMKAYPNVGEYVQARGRTLNVLSNTMQVRGSVDFN